MKKNNFSLIDTQLKRKNDNNVKWGIQTKYQDPQLLPLWVADMDIATFSPIREALKKEIDKKILGYVNPSKKLFTIIANWQESHHQVIINPSQILLTPGVDAGISLAIRYLTKKRDPILVADPYYPPYKNLVEGTGRHLVTFPLDNKAGQYKYDFRKLEGVLATKQIKVLILCNPQNPGGRIWDKSELKKISDLSQKYQVLIFSDEIHNELFYDNHHPVSMLNKSLAGNPNIVVFNSASKAFNLAGTKTAYILLKNPVLLKKLKLAQKIEYTGQLNTLGLVSLKIAYQRGQKWLEELRSYLQTNRNFVIQYLKKYLPKIKFMVPQATFLIWLDFSPYGYSDFILQKKLLKQCHLYLNPGPDYGKQGYQHMRLNFACNRKLLQKGLDRLKKL